jgi:hypothetical protein
MNTDQTKAPVEKTVRNPQENVGTPISSDVEQAHEAKNQVHGKEKEQIEDKLDVLNP